MKKLVFFLSVFLFALFLHAEDVNRKQLETGKVAEAVKAFEAGDCNTALNLLIEEIQSPRGKKNGYAYFYEAYILQYSDFEELGIDEKEAEILQDPNFILYCYDNAIKYLPKKDKRFRNIVLFYKALLYRKLEDFENSNKCLDKAIEVIENAELWAEKGQNYIFIEQYDEALSSFIRANNIEEKSKHYVGMAIAYINMGNYDEAIKMIEIALEYDDDYKNYAYIQMARAYIAKEEYVLAIKPTIISYLFTSSDLAWEQYLFLSEKVPDQVIAQLKIAFVQYPENELQIKNMLARTYFDKQDYNNVLKYALPIVEAYPSDFIDMYWVSATAYYELGDYKSSLNFVDKIFDIDSTLYLYKFRSDIYFELGDLNKSLDYINLAIKEEPEAIGFYATRAFLYECLGKIDEAIDDWSLIMALEPTLSYSYLQRAILLKQQGKNIAAEADLNKSIELDIAADDYRILYFSYFYLGEKEKAIKAFLEGYDRKEVGDYNAACFYSLMNEKELALRYLERALDSGFNQFVHIHFDDDLDNIRDLPEFKVLLEKYKK